MLSIAIFLMGLLIGSFLNCVVYRIEMRDKGGKAFGFLRGRSHCPHCQHILNVFDLVPVFSFLFLRGKCRYCRQKISLQYPLVEILTALIFLLIFNFQFSIFNVIFWILISCFLIIIFIYDLKHFIIPDKVLFPAIGITLLYNVINPSFLNFLLAGLGASAFFLFFVLVSRGKWMGLGDVKLAILIGLLLGFPKTIIVLFFAFLIGAIMGVGLILFNKKTLKSEVPFGPFLIIGIYIALFFGQEIVNWYLTFFFI